MTCKKWNWLHQQSRKIIGYKTVLRIRDVYPGSRIQGQKHFGSLIKIHIKEFSIFIPKKLFKALGNMIRDVHHGSLIRIFILYPYRIQGSKRHRFPDPDPQHWYKWSRPWKGDRTKISIIELVHSNEKKINIFLML